MIAMTLDFRGTWQVERDGGNSNHSLRVIFAGSEELARAKFAKLKEALRQGEVRLTDPSGNVVDRCFAPRLRTRW